MGERSGTASPSRLTAFILAPGSWLLAPVPWLLTPGSFSYGLAGVSGLLLFLSFPLFDLSFLAWAALAPLLVALHLAPSRRRGLLLGGLCGTIYFAGLVYWVPEVMRRYGELAAVLAFGVYLLMVLLLALFIAAFGLVQSHLARRFKARALLLAPPLWVSLELARNYIPFGGFPWCLLGYSQADRLALIQIADITGVYGISFLLVSVNAGLAYFFLTRGERLHRQLAPLFAAGALIALALGYGGYRLSAEPVSGEPLEIALAQANIPFKSWRELAPKFYQEYPHMIGAAAERGAKLVVLPESPTPFSYQNDTNYRRHLEKVVAENRVWLLFNNNTELVNGRDTIYHNSAWLLDEGGRFASRYDKLHLVPFGEYVPMQRILFFAGQLVQEVGGYTPGGSIIVSSLDGIGFSTLICYEAIFPNLVHKFVRRGAQFLINITNDGWYGETSAPYQHFQMARLRAVENRRYLARAANTGISGFVDPYGRVLASSGLYTEALLWSQVVPRSDITFYTRFGDVFALSCVMIIITAFLFPLWGGNYDRGTRENI